MSHTRIHRAVANRLNRLYRGAAIAAMNGRKRFDPETALLICADPRGGSTWLAEMLARIPRTVMFWEPLHIGETAMFRHLGFRYRQFIPNTSPAPEAKQAFDSLFSGASLDHYVLHRTSIAKLRRADRALVKFCRATQLLPWLVAHYDFKCRPLHLLRHPCAVVASQMRFGAWDKVPVRFNERDVLDDPLLAPHAEVLMRIDTAEARLAAIWGTVNAVALNHPLRISRWITIYYESLVQSPVETVSGILSNWNLELEGPVDDLALRPSKTTLEGSPIAQGNALEQISYWRKTLDPTQVRRILDTVEALGVTVYSDDPLPRH